MSKTRPISPEEVMKEAGLSNFQTEVFLQLCSGKDVKEISQKISAKGELIRTCVEYLEAKGMIKIQLTEKGIRAAEAFNRVIPGHVFLFDHQREIRLRK